MKKILFLIMAGLTLFLTPSCQNDDDQGSGACNGAPIIDSIKHKIIDKETAIEGSFGDWLIIQGRNFCDVQELLVNDAKVDLSNAYIESGLISFEIPRTIPLIDTKTITVITVRGKSTKGFITNIPELELEGLRCEYVMPGDTAYLVGKNFDLYKLDTLSTVVRIGDSLSRVNYIDSKSVFFRIPKSAKQNDIMTLVKTDSLGRIQVNRQIPGLFRENVNVFFNFAEQIGWEGTERTNGIGKLGYPDSISGNYAVVKGDYAAWQWGPTNYHVVDNIPIKDRMNQSNLLIGSTDNLVLKFEINVMNEWYSNALKFSFFDSYEYWYEPHAAGAFRTTGWQTVRIPLKNWKSTVNERPLEEITANMLNAWTMRRVFYHGGAAATNLFICYDNVRIVPND